MHLPLLPPTADLASAAVSMIKISIAFIVPFVLFVSAGGDDRMITEGASRGEVEFASLVSTSAATEGLETGEENYR